MSRTYNKISSTFLSNRIIFIVLFLSLIAVPVFSHEPNLMLPDFSSLTYYGLDSDEKSIEELMLKAEEALLETSEENAVIAREEIEILEGLRNNEFYRESLRLKKLAQETYDYGDYDASTSFAEEAILYADLSDEYVTSQLLTEAKRLVDWADANRIQTRYPIDYTESKTYYDIGVIAQTNEEWNIAIENAARSIRILSMLEAGGTGNIVTAGSGTLPKQYTVRTWASVRDCFWNIAGYSWVYNDPFKWRTLYEANKTKLPDPNNPDIVEPGTVLDIPSIRGETRQGMWNPPR